MATANQIPTAPYALPLLGHLIPLLRDPFGFISSLPKYGDIVRIRIGSLSAIMVCDPELTAQVLRDDRIFDKGGPLIDRAREVMGDGLATCPRSTHRRLRRLSQPAFHHTHMPGYAQAMKASTLHVINSWHSGQILDIPTEMMTIAGRALTTTMFSDALSIQEIDRLIHNVHTVLDGIVQRMLMIPPLDRLPTSGNRAYWHARTSLHQALEQIITDRRISGVDYDDLLSALLAARDHESDGQGLTDSELINTLVTFFLAGTDTTATTLAWALHLLAQHPQVQQRVQAEVDAVWANGPATYQELPRLDLTNRVITEALRLYPPGWFFTRTVTTSTRLGSYTLPAGSNVVYSPYLIHRRNDLYENSESFDPDRLNPDRLQPPRHSLIPFAAGARKCIGDTFAMTEATLILATITADWELKGIPECQVRPALGTVARPRELRMVAVTRRGLV
ncbi:cytochrome P450 [Streptomyces capillispiralis]|uniref:cytochrome P450 n=1 Tax=Streptomyces capillispiralis TaxID=68182 RepID=UPI0036B96D14